MVNGCKSYWFLDAVKEPKGQSLIFVANNMNGLYKWNMKTSEITLLNAMDDKAFVNEKYANGIAIGDCIFFPPRNTKEMLIYNIQDNSCRYVDIYSNGLSDGYLYNPELLMGHVLVYNKNIYAICREYPCVISINPSSLQCHKLVINRKVNDRLLFSKEYAEFGGVYYFPSSSHNKILVLDTNIEYAELLDLNEFNKSVGFSSALSIGSDIVLLTKDGNYIVKYLTDSKKIEIFELGLACVENSAYKLKYYDDKLFIIPMLDINQFGRINSIYSVNEKFQIEEKKLIFCEFMPKKKWNVYSDDEMELYFLFDATNGDHPDAYWPLNSLMMKLDMNTLECEVIDFPPPQNMLKKEVSKRVESLQSQLALKYIDVVSENNRVNLKQLIDCLCLDRMDV